MIFAAVLAAWALAGCEEAPKPADSPKKIERPVKPAPARDEKRHKERVFFTSLWNASSHIGALQHCRASGLYESKIVEDTFYRIAAIMIPLRDSGGTESVEVSSIGYLLYQDSFHNGRLITTTVPEKDNPNSLFKVADPEPVMTPEACQKIEAHLLDLRKKGGLLDVQPLKPGTPM